MRANFLFIFLFSIKAFSFTVVIDPGHGGIDGGASRGSFIEANIVYQIAEKVEMQLKKISDVKVFLTRTLSKGKSLQDRVQFADLNEADLFLSLHANSSPSNQVSGMEYYFNIKKSGAVLLKSKPVEKKIEGAELLIETVKKDLVEFGKTKSSLDLSQQIQTAWKSQNAGKSELQQSKIRRAPFYVIENTSMPSVLVEVGFISNQREARKLVSAEYQDELAHALTAAIVNYKEKSDK